MTQKPKAESPVDEIHRVRREISDRFGGDISAIADDAAQRLASSGRPIWQPTRTNMLLEHSRVVLACDIPEFGLTAGDVGAVVHVCRNGGAYEVEFVDGDGTTIALITLKSEAVRPVGSGELLHTRHRDAAE